MAAAANLRRISSYAIPERTKCAADLPCRAAGRKSHQPQLFTGNRGSGYGTGQDPRNPPGLARFSSRNAHIPGPVASFGRNWSLDFAYTGSDRLTLGEASTRITAKRASSLNTPDR